MPFAAGSGLGVGPDWQAALDAALGAALDPLHGAQPQLLLLFAGASFSSSYPALLERARAQTAAEHLIGCSASGVIANGRELEDQPGIASLALALPAASQLRSVAVLPDDAETPPALADRLGLAPADCTGLVVLADPFSTDVTSLVARLEAEYPRVPIVGGLATGPVGARHAWVFNRTQVLPGGAVILGLAGAAGIRPVVSQGCEPLGACWTITDADGYVIRTIGNRPAYEVLVETVQALEPAERQRAARNLLVGLAMNEYRDEFKRGDFLIRNIMGADPSSGAIAVGAEPSVGQTLQFQVRDARAADEELRHMLDAARADAPPAAAALLFACNGRGVGLFGQTDHDASTVQQLLGPLPLAGFFCNGEIGPVGGATFLHGFTASLGLITPRPLARGSNP